ncbi:MAG TPA: ABC transporter ATP-binding protein [Rhizomicrobium sp.]|nr:ABC transporter ATP-binding protein [Rhizomicrobium sp.]
MDAVALKKVERRLGDFVLGPLDLTVPRGAVLAFVGPNGAGKTTTLDLMMGMGAPDRGEIGVLGMAMPRDEVMIKSRVAYVSPDLNFTPWGSVGRALDFVRGFYPGWDGQRCDRLLKEFSIARKERIAALSFGARIKLSLVMALSRDAELLLLDEPTVGLDVNARLLLFREILDFVKRQERAAIISSHQLSDLQRLADRVAILNKGRLIASGRMDELVERYVQLDARLTTGGAMPAIDGVTVLERDGGRLRLMLDRRQDVQLAEFGMDVLDEAPMSLEEIFVALVADRVANKNGIQNGVGA